MVWIISIRDIEKISHHFSIIHYFISMKGIFAISPISKSCFRKNELPTYVTRQHVGVCRKVSRILSSRMKSMSQEHSIFSGSRRSIILRNSSERYRPPSMVTLQSSQRSNQCHTILFLLMLLLRSPMRCTIKSSIVLTSLLSVYLRVPE